MAEVKQFGDITMRVITNPEELGIFPQNDTRNGCEDERYRIFKGQVYAMVPQVGEGYKVMTLAEVFQARIEAVNSIRFADGPTQVILTADVYCADGAIVNNERGEIKIVRDILDVLPIKEDTPHSSYADLSISRGRVYPPEKVADLDKRSPSGFIHVPSDKYDTIDGFVIPTGALTDGFPNNVDASLKEMIMAHLLDGNFELLFEYARMQGKVGIDYDRIPMHLARQSGMSLFSIDSYRGKRMDQIGTGHLAYVGGLLATKVVRS